MLVEFFQTKLQKNRDGSLTPRQNGECTIVSLSSACSSSPMSDLSEHNAQISPGVPLGCNLMLLPVNYNL